MSKKINWLFLLLILINVVYVSVGVWRYPIRSDDVFVDWMLKAKAFYVEKGLPLNTLRDPNFLDSHPQYPIFLPFSFYQVFRLHGGICESCILGVYPIIYIAILFCCYRLLRKNSISSPLALMITYVYSMLSPLLAQAGRSHAGNADIIITLLVWLMLSVDNYWVVSLLVMLASMIKFEGIFWLVLILLAPLSWKAKFPKILLILIPTLVWLVIRQHFAIPSDLFFQIPNITQMLIRPILLIGAVLKEMLNFRNWYIFWPLFWWSFAKSKNFFLKKVLLGVSLCFVPIYLISNLDTWVYASSSLDRIFLQLSPVLILIFVTVWQKR